MNNLFNTMSNLISNQNDGTFANIENPINGFGTLAQTAIDTAKSDVNEKIQEDNKIKNALENGATIWDIRDYVNNRNQEKANEILYDNQPSEEDLLNQTLEWAEIQQEKEWKRENEIREHVESREDSALQRWVEDARKAGINPNLFSGQGAASGGGITSATGLNMTQYETQANRLLEEWQTMMEQDFERNENRKDRYTKILSGLLNLAGLGIFAGKAGKANKKK